MTAKPTAPATTPAKHRYPPTMVFRNGKMVPLTARTAKAKTSRGCKVCGRRGCSGAQGLTCDM